MNPHSSDDRNALMEQCAYEGVALVFKHLTIDQMRHPPPQLFDAKLARQTLDGVDASIDAKGAAIRFLSLGDLTSDANRVAVLLSPAQPTELQAATLQALAQQRDPAIADIVLAAWDQLTPELREQAFAVLASREAWRV